MHLYFLRHGQADWPDWDRPDDERPLTKRGKKEIKRIAKFLTRLEVDLDEIVTSPLPRAAQTAEVVAKHYRLTAHEDERLEPGFDQDDLEKILESRQDLCLMIVGHEPDFTDVISGLTGAELKLAKGGLAMVDLNPSTLKGKLLWLFPPRVAKAAL
jgi:phosphohistidine phosphatase